MSAADPRSQMLKDMSECAYRLGMAFGAEAERTSDIERKIELFEHFHSAFFGVRVATALQLRLRRDLLAPAARPGLRAEREVSGTETFRPEALEREPPERSDSPERYTERDREGDRESERASLPLLLRTLRSLADGAAALPGPEPAELPVLRELLARVTTPGPASTAAAAQARTSDAGLRARLTASAMAPALALAAGSLPPPRIGPPLRRATGPPRR